MYHIRPKNLSISKFSELKLLITEKEVAGDEDELSVEHIVSNKIDPQANQQTDSATVEHRYLQQQF